MDGEDVLSLGLKLCSSPGSIQNAFTELKWGNSDTKDFLYPDKTNGVLVTRKCSTQHWVMNIYLSRLTEQVKEELILGTCNVCLIIDY